MKVIRTALRGDYKIDKDRLLDCLAIYGSDMDKWPIDLREEMDEIFKSSPEFLEVLKEEKEFEEIINTRGFEEYSEGFEDKIINLAINKEKYNEDKSTLDLLNSIISIIPIPRPAIALPLLLVLGIATGFFYSSNFSFEESDSIESTQFAELIYYPEGFYE